MVTKILDLKEIAQWIAEEAVKQTRINIGDFPKTGVQQGWQCPLCGRVYSPYTHMCFYCRNNEPQTVISNAGTVTADTPIRDIMTGKTDLTQTLGGK